METISLASGAMYFNTPDVAKSAAIKAIQNNETFYGATEGTLELRQAIANRYLILNQATVNPDNILVTPGTKQALFNILQNILKPGDEVIVPIPNWFGLHQIITLIGAKLVFLPTSYHNNYDIDPEILARLITDKTKLFIYSNPCNPTGRIYTETEIESWLSVLKNYPEIYILADEIYDLVTYDSPVPSLLSYSDFGQKHIVVNGFSKSFAMSGWRIGYLVFPADLREVCVNFQKTTLAGISPLVQAAALAVINQPETILKPMIQVMQEQKEIISDFLTQRAIPFFSPQAGYFVFPDFTRYLQKELKTATEMEKYLKEDHALEILSGDYFGAHGHARLSFAVEKQKLQEALLRLDAAFLALI